MRGYLPEATSFTKRDDLRPFADLIEIGVEFDVIHQYASRDRKIQISISVAPPDNIERVSGSELPVRTLGQE
jgi:hypothetical protein